MELTLKDIDIAILSLPDPVKKYPSLVEVNIEFHDKDTSATPSMRLTIPLYYPLHWTVKQVQEEAFRLAREIIKTAEILEVPHDEERPRSL